MIPQEEHERRMALYRKGYTDSQIAAELTYTQSTISYWRKSRGLPKNDSPIDSKFRELTAEENDMRMELYRKGLVDHQIAEIIGRSPTAIADWRKNRKLEPNGSRCWRKSRINAEMFRAIKCEYAKV